MREKSTGKIIWTTTVERFSDVQPIPLYRYDNTLLLIQSNFTKSVNFVMAINLDNGKIIWEQQLPYLKMWSIAAFDNTFYYHDFTPNQIDLYAGNISQQQSLFNPRALFTSIQLDMPGYLFGRVFEPITFLHPQTKEKMLFISANAISRSGDSVRSMCFLYNLGKKTLVYGKEFFRGRTSFWGFHGINSFNEKVQVGEYYIFLIWGKGWVGMNMLTGKIAWETNTRLLPNTESEYKVRAFSVDTLNYHLWHASLTNLAQCVDVRTGKEVKRRGFWFETNDQLNLTFANNILYFGGYRRWVAVDSRDGRILYEHEGIDNMQVFGAISVVEDKVFTRVYYYLYCLQAIP
jgi:hypothetical protein